MRKPILIFEGKQTTLQSGDQMILLRVNRTSPKKESVYFLTFKRKKEEILSLQGGYEGGSHVRLLYYLLQDHAPLIMEIAELLAAACGLSVEVEFLMVSPLEGKIEEPITVNIYTFR